jgi:hypothetical protein
MTSLFSARAENESLEARELQIRLLAVFGFGHRNVLWALSQLEQLHIIGRSVVPQDVQANYARWHGSFSVWRAFMFDGVNFMSGVAE